MVFLAKATSPLLRRSTATSGMLATLKDYFSLPDIAATTSMKPPEITILNFKGSTSIGTTLSQKEEDDGWMKTSDKVIGGHSKHKLSFPTYTPRKDSSPEEKMNSPTNYLEWKGRTSTKLPRAKTSAAPSSITSTKLPLNVVRSGFVSIKSPLLGTRAAGSLRLDEYESLGIVARLVAKTKKGSSGSSSSSTTTTTTTTTTTDEDVNTNNDEKDETEKPLEARTLIVNLHVDSYIPGDVYQGYVKFQPTTDTTPVEEQDWQLLTHPFREFLLTGDGRVRELQRPLEGFTRLKNIGFLLADGMDGEFEIHIKEVYAS